MFTGIVEEVGRIQEAGPGRLVIAAATVLEDAFVGSSMAVNGACLTIVSLDTHSFTVHVVPETTRRTNLGLVKPRAQVNLERPLSLSGRFGGHMVQGHVDGTASIAAIRPEGEARLMEFEVPAPMMRYIVEKGFIAIDGVSLTVVNCEVSRFTVSVIPFTLDNTNLGGRQEGDMVNLEVDILAKYVEKLLRSGTGQE